jgi:hypothetical protein
MNIRINLNAAIIYAINISRKTFRLVIRLLRDSLRHSRIPGGLCVTGCSTVKELSIAKNTQEAGGKAVEFIFKILASLRYFAPFRKHENFH